MTVDAPLSPDQLIATNSIWSWSTATTQPPNNRQVRTDTGLWVSAVEIWISPTDNNNNDFSPQIAALKSGDMVRFDDNTDDNNWAEFAVTGPSVLRTSYYSIPVTPTVHGGVTPPANNTNVLVNAIAASDTGDVVKLNIQLLPSEVNTVTQTISVDLVNLIAEALQTVAHLVSHADFNVYVQGGAIIPYSFDIKPPIVGEEFP